MPLSAKQMEYLALAWQCFESEPKINYARFATVAGLASPASARELMRVTKNKLKDEYGALSTTLQTSNTTTTTTTTPQPRTPKRKTTTTITTATTTPASRKRGRKVLAEPSGVEEDGENEEKKQDLEADVSVPAAKKARTKAKASSALVSTVSPAVDADADADDAGEVKVKSEFVAGEGYGGQVLGEEEVSIF